jgi:hypothetical protein
MTTQICNANTGIKLSSTEYESLQVLYNSTNGRLWIWLGGSGIPWNFMDGSDPCVNSWQGISCTYISETNSKDDCVGYVQEMELQNHHIVGQLPSACLGNFVYMTTLLLGTNSIYGPIPSDIGLLQSLISLGLPDNYFFGSVKE